MNDLLSVNEVLALVGCSIDSLRAWMRKGKFPRPTHQRGRNKFWSRATVERAVAKLTRKITA